MRSGPRQGACMSHMRHARASEREPPRFMFKRFMGVPHRHSGQIVRPAGATAGSERGSADRSSSTDPDGAARSTPGRFLQASHLNHPGLANAANTVTGRCPAAGPWLGQHRSGGGRKGLVRFSRPCSRNGELAALAHALTSAARMLRRRCAGRCSGQSGYFRAILVPQ